MSEEKDQEIQDAKDLKTPEKNNQDQVALELMKFITVATGYGKGTPSAGFAGKSTVRSAEEQAEALIDLFQRCRRAVKQEVV